MGRIDYVHFACRIVRLPRTLSCASGLWFVHPLVAKRKKKIICEECHFPPKAFRRQTGSISGSHRVSPNAPKLLSRGDEHVLRLL
jgi:hypothetical protein